MVEGSVLVGIQMMMCQLAMCHPTDGMDKILTVQIFESILVRIVCVGVMVKLMSGGILNTILVMSILGKTVRTRKTTSGKRLTRYASSLNMNGVMA